MAPLVHTLPALRRERLEVRGQVQGVGFRPLVYRLARELDLGGWVRNDGRGVTVEVQGEPEALERFAARLPRELPPLARIDTLERRHVPIAGAHDAFTIVASRQDGAATQIVPDTAVCPACLAELFNPADRRWRYPFINCTHCGPRYTLTKRLPYDRPHTTMAAFRQCPSCLAEYRSPEDRRFHAQPNACPACGPQLTWQDAEGRSAGDPLAAALACLRGGGIVAVKGLGGFHLAVDARNGAAVARLRARKRREEKPFAVMAANRASLAPVAALGDTEAALLASPERPIVLLRKSPGCDDALPGCAPGVAWLGAMLPYTPLHYLLFHEAAGRPAGDAWLDAPQALLLVMTSANPGGEPLVIDNDEALARLAGIADGFLLHDRDIALRCDDSVVRPQDGTPAFIRRARGYTPQRIALPAAGPATLALGGWFKNTVCVTRGAEAFVSQHVGDLDNPATCAFLEEVVAHLLEVLEIAPAQVACDLHPDFHSSRFAAEFAARAGLPLVAVQHHHAHVAAVAAEHGLAGPVLGLALDGVGLGSDGGAWGGELLQVAAGRSERLAHVRPLPLPGGDRAAREPWRMAAAALFEARGPGAVAERFPGRPGAALAELLERGVHCPPSSSMGRWFDAAAGLLEVRRVSAFEGQAAMLLEGLAEAHGPVAADVEGFRIDGFGRLDLLPLLTRLSGERDAPFGAALFHATLVAALGEWVAGQSRRTGVTDVVLAGGCFLNRLLSEGLAENLARHHIRVHRACRLPPNDGGLSLGQAWTAIQQAAAGLHPSH